MIKPLRGQFLDGYSADSKLGDPNGYTIGNVRFTTFDGVNWMLTLRNTTTRVIQEIFNSNSTLGRVITALEQQDYEVTLITRDGVAVYEASYTEDSDWPDGYDPADDTDTFDGYDFGDSDPDDNPDDDGDHPPSVVTGY